MAGVLIATELVKYLNGIDTIRNKMLLYFGRTYETMKCNYSRNVKCTIHDKKFDLIKLEVIPEMTLRDILIKLNSNYGSSILCLPDDFVLTGRCHICGKPINYDKRKNEIWDDERWCAECRIAHENYTHIIEYANAFKKVPKEVTLGSDDYILNRTLSEVGIPLNDILEGIFMCEEENKFRYIYLKNK